MGDAGKGIKREYLGRKVITDKIFLFISGI